MNRLLVAYPSLLVASGSTAATFTVPQWLCAPLAAVVILALLDARARWTDYLWLINALGRINQARYLRLIAPFRHSWCQRTVAYFALRKFGRGRDALGY
ncbi:MAG: hypothetical protein QNI95_15760, partial [Desulfobacterales bacterium]|nr:hypothetical protein [Desulfobacterales bacterium]